MADFNEVINIGGTIYKIPPQKNFDFTTRIDELLVILSKAVVVLNQSVIDSRPKPMTELKNILESGQQVDYQLLTLSMDTARNDESITIQGKHLTAAVSNGATLEGTTVRFNMSTTDAVPMDKFNPWNQEFFRIYLTHTAQPGKHLYLAIGKSSAADTKNFTLSAEIKNKVSAVLDSTIIPLVAADTYTGGAFTVDEYARIVGSIYSDVAGMLYVDQRNDGVNWDVMTTIPYTAAAKAGFSVEVVGIQARLRYVNGAVNQAAFQLYARARRI